MLLNTFETEMKYLKNILGSYLFFIGILGFLWPGCVADKNGQSELKAKAVKAEALKILPERYNVAFLVMNGVFNTELTAPYDVFQHTQYRENIKSMNVFTVANTNDYIRTFEGLHIKPDYNYLEDDLPNIDILVVPSAEHHIDTDLKDTAMIAWVKDIGQKAMFVTSHCDGAFVLAQAGLLNGIACTTFPADIKSFKESFPSIRIYENVVLVHDKNVITSSGGAKSFDAALYLIQLLYGKAVTDKIAKGLVIDWDLNDVKKVVVHQGNGYSTL